MAHRLWTCSTEDKGKRELRRQRPLEDKESVRWIDVTKEARTVIPDSTKVIMVGDRESGIFDLFLLAVNNHDFLVRAAWDRRLHDSDDHL
ncbi:hypothetical protein [Sulfoacidibacillus ferrooxidans]|uniref:hypothetical protein n=1 Tax=Sulfoacidibacillus ferrooxidans TaxID=2005001 RepID=UPI001F50A143|nr:hypothetical protein [Sulfoacidibacillus ferrooxidans]